MFFSYFNTDCLVVSTVWGVLNNYRVGYIHHFFQQNAGFFSHPFEKKNAKKVKFLSFRIKDRGENTYIDETMKATRSFSLPFGGGTRSGSPSLDDRCVLLKPIYLSYLYGGFNLQISILL